MKLINNKNLYFFENVETLLFALFALTIPFKLNIGNAVIIISFLYALYLLVKKRVSTKNFKSFYFIIPVLLFLISVISALTSKNIYEGVFQLEKLLLMLIIPFVLIAFKDRYIRVLKVIFSFSFGVSLATLILLVINCVKIIKGAPLEKLFFFDFTLLYDQHPVYFSTYLVISFFLVVHYFLVKFKPIPVKWIYLVLLIHLLGLIFCASKAVLICFFAFLFFYSLVNRNTSRKFLLITSSILLLVAMNIFFIPNLKQRFANGLVYNSKEFVPTQNLLETKKFTYDEKTNISDLELRVIFFKIGLYHTLNDGKALFGYGLGDVQNYLDYYYMSYNLAPNWYEGFNLHNQYLHYFATYGIFALSLFIFYLFYSVIISIKTKNSMHFLFMLMILFVFLFEVYLARNKGIVILFFFNTFFLTQSFKFEDRDFRY